MTAVEMLKQKLCAALDQLTDADGFVLVATADDVHFTRLKAAGWSEDRVLKLEPLNLAVEQNELGRVRAAVAALAKRKQHLVDEIAELEKRRADLQAAVDTLLGRNR